MQNFLKLNTKLAILIICVVTIMSCYAMNTRGCLQIDFGDKSYKAGFCSAR